jgi:type IV secretion system protein VirD4
VVNDPKMELFDLTSGHRKNVFDNEVFLWAPTKEKTHRYNPLSFISDNKNKRIGDIQLIAHTIIPDGRSDPIWYQSSRELFLALVLYLLDTEHETVTLPQVYVLSKQYKFNDWLKSIVELTHDLDPEFYRNAGSYLNTAEKTRASILKTFTGYLEIFANPVISAATSASDFDLRALRKKKITIYVGFSENEKEMISPLLTIFWQQLISSMCEKIPDRKAEPYDLLCLMEEFSILGRLVNLKSSLKILRGYHVRVLIIIQYFSQTLEFYSKAEAEAFKNIKTKVSFALDSYEDAQYMSQLLGMQTKKITSHGSTNHFDSGSTSKNTQLQAVPLMRPEEIQRLKPYKAIILRTGSPPVMAKQYRWYQVRELKYLKQDPVSVPDQKPLMMPFEKIALDENKNKNSNDLQSAANTILNIEKEISH